MREYEQHPIAKFVPPMLDQDFDALCADMEAKGQLEPIKLYQGKILDGWSRYRACLHLEIEPWVIEWQPKPGQSVVGAVVSWNLPRRHLSSAQKAALALEIEPELAREARERQRAAGGSGPHERHRKKKTDKADTPDEPEVDEPHLVEGKKQDQAGRAAEQAAKIAGTNRQYVSDAKRIRAYSEKLFNQIKNGELAFTDAKKIMRTRQKAAEWRKALASVPKSHGKPSWQIQISDAAFGLQKIEKGSVRLIVTQPSLTENRIQMREPKHWKWVEEWMEACYRTLTPDGSLFLICDPDFEHRFRYIADKLGMTTRGFPWHYGGAPRPRSGDFPESYLSVVRCRVDKKHYVFHPQPFTLEGGRLWQDIWGLDKSISLLTDAVPERIPGFPQQLPLELVLPIVEAHSEPGDLVLDPFSGSATVGAACIQLGGRKYIGFEKSEPMARLSIERLQAIPTTSKPKEPE